MPPLPQLTTTEWLMLPTETRNKLSVMFHLPLTGQRRSVQEGIGHMRIESDGHTHADLRHINLDTIAIKLGEPKGTNFHDEFDKLLARLNQDETPAPTPAVPDSIPDVAPVRRKGGRPKKETAE